MARGNYAPRLTSCLHARAIVHDRVVGRPVIEPNGWPKGQKTVDDETVSGNCWSMDAISCTRGHGTLNRDNLQWTHPQRDTVQGSRMQRKRKDERQAWSYRVYQY